MPSSRLRISTLLLLVVALMFAGCMGYDGKDGKNGKSGTNGTNGTDGTDGVDGQPGPPGPTVIMAAALSDEQLAALDVVSQITGVTIASPPQVTFTLQTAGGIPITDIVPFWEDSSRYVRFTITKLVPGMNGDPDSWVSYTRDAESGEPDYDTGSSLVDHGDGSYTFTFNTDVANVDGVTYEPTLTHRVAGQIGASNPPLEPQNLVFDFVPDGSAVTLERKIATMASCNECHSDLVFHGRRFLVEYCVNCHNPDLADGEGNMSLMIHTIHDAGDFDVLDDGVDFSEVTYPQDLANCRKCHNGEDAATPQGDNWKNRPNIAACDACHHVFAEGGHTGGPQSNNAGCAGCHPPAKIEEYHTTTNATPNNPDLLSGEREITYELISAEVDGETNDVTIEFKILSDGNPLDLANLPQDLLDGDRYPTFLLAWAMPQHGIDEPMDYNNMGESSGQPRDVDIDELSPLAGEGSVGTLSYNLATGVNTAVITDTDRQFPDGATLRAVGLQGYLRQDLDGDGAQDVSLHTPAAVIAVTDDDERRVVVDSAKCSNCHEWFEGHGGNRVYNMQICTMCHVPNLSSSGRAIEPPPSDGLLDDFDDATNLDPTIDPDDPLTYPEDAQNLRDLVHGIHSSGFRTRAFTHVRGGREGYYDWSEVTFPRGSSTSNCLLCHDGGTYRLPLDEGLLGATVRTTGVNDGDDEFESDVADAEDSVPNSSDWINTPMAGSCFYCHTSWDAMAHMMQNGALLSAPRPADSAFENRENIDKAFETCAVCHGPGRIADLDVVHNK